MKNMEIAAVLPKIDNDIMSKETAMCEGVVECRNLRPDTSKGGRLVPTEDFEVVASLPAGSKTVGTISHEDYGKCCIIYDEDRLYVVSGIGNPSRKSMTFAVDKPCPEPMTVLETGKSTSLIMTKEGPYELICRDGVFELRDINDVPPSAILTIDTEQEIPTTIDSHKLKGTYDRESRMLEPEDCRILTQELKKAYGRLTDKARHASFFIEPVMVRYRYLDYKGNTVYLSPIKTIVPESENTLGKIINCKISGDKRTEFTVTATGVRIKLRTPEADNNWEKRVERLIVECSGNIPIVDTTVTETENHVIGTDNLLRFYMPGCSTDIAEDKDCRAERVKLALRYFDDLCKNALEIESPFGEQSGKEFIVPMPTELFATEPIKSSEQTLKLLKKLSSKRISRKGEYEAELLQSFSLPHRFTAGSGAINGNTTLWSGLIQLPAKGWHIHDLTLKSIPGKAWKACCIVETGDNGHQTVWSGEGNGDAPTLLTPTIYYPSSDAKSLEIRVETDEGVSILRSSLTKLPGTGLSIAEITGPEPIKLTYTKGISYSVPQHKMEARSLDGWCLSATANEPLSPVSVHRITSNKILEVTRATATSSAWDYSRSRFYSFGLGGTAMVIANDKSVIVASQRIDNRGIVSRRHVIEGAAGKGVTVAAGNKIFHVKGSGITELPGTVSDVCGIGLDGEDLWIVNNSGSTTVRPSTFPRNYYTRDLPEVRDMFTLNDNILVITDKNGQLYDSSRRMTSAKEIEWSCRIYLPGVVKPPVRGTIASIARITSIGLRMVATAVRARFTATSDCDSPVTALARLLLSVLLEGSLKSPVFFPVRGTQRSYLTLSLKGVVSSDMRLRGVGVRFGD